MKKRAPLLIIPALLVVGAVVYFMLQRGAGPDRGVLRVSGNIEVVDAQVSFRTAGRLVERRVDEGDLVKKGDVIARLDDTELLQSVALAQAQLASSEAVLAELVAGSRLEEISSAQAAVARARASLDGLLAGSRPQEVAAAEAAVASASANLDNATAEYKRQRELFSSAVSSRSVLDSARTAYEAASAALTEAEERFKLVKEGPRKEDIEQARAALAQANEQYALVRAGPRKETVDNARAQVEAARQTLALAQTRASYAVVTSPLDGVVLSKNIEPGEYVAPGTPVVTVGDLVNIYLRAYVAETDLARIRIGQKVSVTTDTYPGKTYEGKLSFISSEAEFTPKNVQTPRERVKLVYRVKIDIHNPGMELKAGMPADGLLEVGGKAD